MNRDEYEKVVEAGVREKVTDRWTDKQLATMRQNCVTIAIEWYKVIKPCSDFAILEFAEELYSYILKHKLPTKGE